MSKYVVAVPGESRSRFYTALRTADDEMYLPVDPLDPYVITADERTALGNEVRLLKGRGLDAFVAELQTEERRCPDCGGTRIDCSRCFGEGWIIRPIVKI